MTKPKVNLRTDGAYYIGEYEEDIGIAIEFSLISNHALKTLHLIISVSLVTMVSSWDILSW